MHVPGEQCDALGVDRTEVSVAKHHHQERLRCLENHREHLAFTFLGPAALQTTPKYCGARAGSGVKSWISQSPEYPAHNAVIGAQMWHFVQFAAMRTQPLRFCLKYIRAFTQQEQVRVEEQGGPYLLQSHEGVHLPPEVFHGVCLAQLPHLGSGVKHTSNPLVVTTATLGDHRGCSNEDLEHDCIVLLYCIIVYNTTCAHASYRILPVYYKW